MKNKTFGGGSEKTTYAVLTLVSSILATLSSATILYLIHKMKLKNGHIFLIYSMTMFQFWYDIWFFCSVASTGSSFVFDLATVFEIFCGSAGALTSNVIGFVAFYVVKTTQSIDVLKMKTYIFIFVGTLPAVNTILYIMSCHKPYYYLEKVSQPQMYYYTRLVSIGVNFIFSFATMILVRYKTQHLARTNKKPSVSERAIRLLSTRLNYYPIVQAIARAPIAWYEMQYKFKNFDPDNATAKQFVAQCFVAVLTPSASIGFLFIFLLMQPNAYDCLICTLQWKEYKPKTQLSAADIIVRKSTAVRQSTINTMHTTSGGTNSDRLSEFTTDHMTVRDSEQEEDFDLNEVDDEELWILASHTDLNVNSSTSDVHHISHNAL